MKVLLFSNDLMPFGELPTSGGGLRCWQLKKGLEAHGIEVHSSMPGFTYLAEKHFAEIPEPQRELLWRWETQDEIFARVKPDAVLYASNWDHFNLTRPISVPLIVDLHGSRLIETAMWNNRAPSDKKVMVFGKADCLLCAGKRQRNYFYGWLVQAGRVPEDEHFIRYIPVSLSPEVQNHQYPSAEDFRAPHFVSGGGWFPWQNQAKAIFAICEQIKNRKRGTIDIFGTPHESQAASSEELMIRDIYARVKALSEDSGSIRVHGYIGRNDLLEIYKQASVAVEVMRYNLERELAFTTRTIEYLWCGLPVLYNDFGEISGHIREYDAGWTVNPDSDQDIAAALDEIFSSPEAVARKGENAKRLVQDRFSWDKTIEPLVAFLQNPRKATRCEPALGPVCARAPFLRPTGTSVDVLLRGENQRLRQPFTVPAENIKTVEVPLSLDVKAQNSSPVRIELSILKGGKVVTKKKIVISEDPPGGVLEIDFPLWSRPRGGQDYILEFVARSEHEKTTGVMLRGLLEPVYPLRRMIGEPILGRTLLGEELPAEVLALGFVPGGGRYYRIKSMYERAVWMVRRGEWGRLWRAGLRRGIRAAHGLRQAAFG
jgi:glycosyltransferase involved in cell wall biosynthesis